MMTTGTKTSCRCDACVGACLTKPGWFLPGEAERAAASVRLTPEAFFRRYLAVDYWEAEGGRAPFNRDVFALSPAVTTGAPGDVSPADPRGRCVFLRPDNSCGIHEAKPFECRDALHSNTDAHISRRKRRVVRAWATPAAQGLIARLLGRPPHRAEGQWGILDALRGGLGSLWSTEARR